MRKFLAFMLLASAATAPALAAAPGDHHGWQSRGDSSQQSKSDDRGNRSNGDRPHVNRGNDGGGGDHSQPAVQVETHRQPVMHVESANNGGGNNANADNGQRRHFNGVVNRISSGDEAVDQPTQHDTLRGVTRNTHSGPKVVEPVQDRAVSDLRDQRRTTPNVFRNRVPIVSTTPHEGTQPPLRVDHHRRPSVNWSTTHWRNDHRYDWKDWRHKHRSIFHLGFYYDPFGWGYQPYQIGWRLWPSYYSNRYWINDPWQYRLPYAPPGTQWIRYWNDAILVDTWTGEVVDVIPNFFW